MQTIAQGKDAVLNYLENALKDINKDPGAYMLQRDDAGNLVLFFAGLTFICSGTVYFSGNLLDVLDGRMHKLQKPS